MSNKPVQKARRGRPPKSGLDFENARDALIRSGVELLTEKGFNNTGIDEILKRVNVPKGSFYHYFENKEAYGHTVIDSYSRYFINKLNKYLLNEQEPALDCLQSFVTDAMHGMARFDYKRGCLIGNMAQELGNSHDIYRDKLASVFEHWRQLVADCLERAIQEGVLAKNADTKQLAHFFWIGWEGAVMHAKLTRNNQPMALFAGQFFALLPKARPNNT